MRSLRLLPLAFGVAGACSATHQTFETTSTGGAGTGGDSATSSGVGFGGFQGTGGNTAHGSCSSDLQSIVDDAGYLIKMCPADQGCAEGQCVPACNAAAQSKGSIGCDFFAPDSPFLGNGQPGGTTLDGSCYAVFVANAWSRPAKITVSRSGKTFDLTKFGYIPSGIIPSISYDPVPPTGLPPGQVAVLFLSHKPGAMHPTGTPLTCPRTPALIGDAAIQGSGLGNAFHVVSDTPITAYDIMPYGGALSYLPSASLLYPSTAWGTNYYAVAPHPDGGGRLWMLVVGSADGTKVTVAPPTTLPGGVGLPAALGGQATDFTLDAGQMLQWSGVSPTDPGGTVLQSTKPVGVFSGSTELRVATQTSVVGGAHDSAHQQLPQINALGSEYVGANIVTRLASMEPESIPYRLLGVVDGTTLSYDPVPPPGAPTQLAAGQIAEFETTALFVVRSQDDTHPFGMTHYMPGAPEDLSRDGCSIQPLGGSCNLGDEDWVTTLPPRQFLQRYVFFTDPTYGTTNLVLTRMKNPDGFADVTIDCLGGAVTGWLDVDGAGKYQVAYVDLVRGTVPVAQCNGSAHEAKSKGAFGVTVWGTDLEASYGYPAGGNVGSINNVKVPTVPN